MSDLARLEEKLLVALDELIAQRHEAFSRLVFAESERVARTHSVDAALVRDHYEQGARLEWLLSVHLAPPPDRRFPRARCFLVTMTQAGLDAKRRERHLRAPLYAHLEQKYRRIATAKHALWIRRSFIGREGIDAHDAKRGQREAVRLARCTLPPMPRLATERYVSGHDAEHAAFMHGCIGQAGGPLAHRQLVRLFLEGHGKAFNIDAQLYESELVMDYERKLRSDSEEEP